MLKYSAPFAAFMLACAPAQAATITVDHELDPALISSNPFQDILSSPFVAGLGDTVEFNLTFTGGPISLTGDTYLWAVSFSTDDNVRLITTSTWTFLSPSSNLIAGPITFDETSEFGHVGSAVYLGAYRLDNAPITFSGIKVSISIDALEPPGFGQPLVDPREYYSIALVTDGVLAPSVPEPASWALMIGGFALAGGVLRRRSVSIAFA